MGTGGVRDGTSDRPDRRQAGGAGVAREEARASLRLVPACVGQDARAVSDPPAASRPQRENIGAPSSSDAKGSSRNMSEETIVAIFDSAYAAGAACAELIDAGLPDDAITWTSAAAAQVTANSRPRRERSFWSNLFGGEPDHDTVVYDRSLEGGADVLTVRVPAELVARAAAILERHRPVDIEERARAYRLTPLPSLADDDTIYGSGEAMRPSGEEQSPTGGRLLDRGTTRVRRFVVEMPVELAPPPQGERVAVDGDRDPGFAEARDPFGGAAMVPTAPGTTPMSAPEPMLAAGPMLAPEPMPAAGPMLATGTISRLADEPTSRRAASDRAEWPRDGVGRGDAEIVHLDDVSTAPGTRQKR